MTSRLYYKDAYRTAFDGRITEISADGRRVYLDESAFYPTSGGQPFDLGHLDGRAIAEIVDEEDRVAHVLAEPLSQRAVGVAAHSATSDCRRVSGTILLVNGFIAED